VRRSDLSRMPIKRQLPSPGSLDGPKRACCGRLSLFRHSELETCQACVPRLPRVLPSSVPEARHSACALYFRNSDIDANLRASSRMLDKVHRMGRQFAAHFAGCVGRKTSAPFRRCRQDARTPGEYLSPQSLPEVCLARRPPRGKMFSRNVGERRVAPVVAH
jgi:hypothetical protein